MSPANDGFAKLREPFPSELVGKLPKAGVTLDFVGHGAVTSRLLEVDPHWNWEPLALDEHGLPLFYTDQQGNPVGLWIKLTVLEVTRLGYGTVKAGVFDAEKQLIGDALRNAAMRFGVALDLWIKGSAEDDERAQDDRQRPARGPRGGARASGNVPVCAGCSKSLAGAEGVVRREGKRYHSDCASRRTRPRGRLQPSAVACLRAFRGAVLRYLGPSLVAEHGSNRAAQPIENLEICEAFGMLSRALDSSIAERVWWFVEEGE